MSKSMQKRLARRFDIVARAMGWTIGRRWHKDPTTGQNYTLPAHYDLQKHGRANLYEINATVNEMGGETIIYGPCRDDKMLAWLDGILAGMAMADNDRVQRAIQVSNEARKE